MMPVARAWAVIRHDRLAERGRLIMKKIIETTEGKPARGSAKPSQLTTLEKGQIWKMGESYLEVTEIGKRLVHYKLATKTKQRGLRSHMASSLTVQAFLTSNRAE